MTTATPSLSIPSGSLSQNILLDSSIRDWVVLPLLILMIEAGLLRHYLSQVLNAAKGKNMPKIEKRVKSACIRASKLRSGAASFLSRSKWEARRLYWTDNETGYFCEELQWVEEEKDREQNGGNDDGGGGESEKSTDSDMPDPMAMMGPMKGQAVFMIQNMVMMQGIAYFFQGYVLVKVPFPLTTGFKQMFQRGLDLSTLETSYVSSVSWYFLVMYGLRAFFRLVIESGSNGGGGTSQEQMESFTVQGDLGVTMSGNPMPNKFDPNAVMMKERENLEITRFKGRLDDAERRLLGKKNAKKTLSGAGAANSGGEPGYDIFGVGTKSTKQGGGNSKSTRKVKAN